MSLCNAPCKEICFFHYAAKGRGGKRGWGKKRPKGPKCLLKKRQTQGKGYQKVPRKEREWPTPFCLPPLCGTLLLNLWGEYSRPGSAYVVAREFPPRPGSVAGRTSSGSRLGTAGRKMSTPIDILEEEEDSKVSRDSLSWCHKGSSQEIVFPSSSILSGNPNGGLGKRGLGPKGANWAKKGSFRGNFCSSLWPWGVEELVPVGPDRPWKSPNQPRRGPIFQNQFPPDILWRFGAQAPVCEPPFRMSQSCEVRMKILSEIVLNLECKLMEAFLVPQSVTANPPYFLSVCIVLLLICFLVAVSLRYFALFILNLRYKGFHHFAPSKTLHVWIDSPKCSDILFEVFGWSFAIRKTFPVLSWRDARLESAWFQWSPVPNTSPKRLSHNR